MSNYSLFFKKTQLNKFQNYLVCLSELDHVNKQTTSMYVHISVVLVRLRPGANKGAFANLQ